MIGDNLTITLNQLNSVRYRKTKFICINDQMENPTTELKQILQDFYLSFFPFPSQFELPPSRMNPTLHYDEYLLLRSIATTHQHAAHQFYHSLHQSYIELYLQTLQTFRNFLIESLWELDQWLFFGMHPQQQRHHQQQKHPSSALIHWSKGQPERKRNDGIDLFLPYSSLFWGSIGLCCLIGVRLLFRFHRRRQMRTKKNNLEIFSGLIDSEKRRYYQTSSASASGGGRKPNFSGSSSSCLEDEENGRGRGKGRGRGRERREGQREIMELEEGKTESMECDEGEEEEYDERPSYDYEGDELFKNARIVREGAEEGEEEEGEEDLLNKLWRTAGYGVAGESPPTHPDS
jgi:hypothetical protein